MRHGEGVGARQVRECGEGSGGGGEGSAAPARRARGSEGGAGEDGGQSERYGAVVVARTMVWWKSEMAACFCAMPPPSAARLALRSSMLIRMARHSGRDWSDDERLRVGRSSPPSARHEPPPPSSDSAQLGIPSPAPEKLAPEKVGPAPKGRVPDESGCERPMPPCNSRFMSSELSDALPGLLCSPAVLLPSYKLARSIESMAPARSSGDKLKLCRCGMSSEHAEDIEAVLRSRLPEARSAPSSGCDGSNASSASISQTSLLTSESPPAAAAPAGAALDCCAAELPEGRTSSISSSSASGLNNEEDIGAHGGPEGGAPAPEVMALPLPPRRVGNTTALRPQSGPTAGRATRCFSPPQTQPKGLPTIGASSVQGTTILFLIHPPAIFRRAPLPAVAARRAHAG